MKADAPALLGAGVHHVTSHRLKEIAVDPFPQDQRRMELFGKFLAWRDEIRAMGISGSVWLDGSFMTAKHEPGDIDLVFYLEVRGQTWSPVQQMKLTSLLDRATSRAVYGLDLYPVDALDPDLEQKASYWRGWFGFCRDKRTAKGIAEVVI